MKINAKRLTVLSFVACFMLAASGANAWSIFGKSEKAGLQTKEVQKQSFTNIPMAQKAPEIYRPLTKGDTNLLIGMPPEKIEMLRKLLIHLYKWNNDLSEALKNEHWQDFTKTDLITPESESNTIRKKIRYSIAHMDWNYTSLIFVFSGLFDSCLKHSGGVPFEPGDTKTFLWGDDNPITRDIDEGDPLYMTEEEVVSWMRECQGHTSCWNNVPLMKFDIWYSGYYIGDMLNGCLYSPDSTPLHCGMNWTLMNDTCSENYGQMRDLWKSLYENPKLFGVPMPTE